MFIIFKIFDFFVCLFNIFFIKKFLHIYQLKDYNNTRYLNHLFKHKYWFIAPIFLLTILSNIIANLGLKICFTFLSIVLHIWFCITLIKQNKTPLQYTNKIKRLYLISALILISTLFLPKILLISQILIVFSPIFANFLNFYDKIKNLHFIKTAQKKLKNSNTKVIAITGSNGKTSVKNILLSMLSTQYKVQATPMSYNTPLGISKFINDQLDPDCDFIILEYGARHKNDVKKLCKIYGADYGILTTISPQHLQTFKSINNVAKAKSELPKFLNNKPCVFNIDNSHCNKMYAEKFGKKFSVSILGNADIFASQIKVENFTTTFRLHTTNSCSKITTNLLGSHNVTNILLSVALSLELNVKIENIVKSIANLKPTPHRLQYIKSHIHILDDSYNCSISSATEAINVLKSTRNKKMIVTPGIIEGGKNQFELNFKLGKMCRNLDYVIIVGETNKKAILSGIKLQKHKCKIILCKSLNESKHYFYLLKPNDCLLLLNDLPDDYH